MNNNLFPCIWLNKNGSDAAKFYVDTFRDLEITENTPMVKMLELSGQKLMLLDAESPFKPNPCISLLIAQKDEQETERLYKILKEKGNVLMPLDIYPFSEKYAWVEDQFGVSWQLYTGEKGDTDQYFVPHMMFVEHNTGKAKAAMNFYTSIFKNSSIKGVLEYAKEKEEKPGYVKHAQFQLNDFMLSCMESSVAHQFNFTEAVSLVVLTQDQEETDYLWNSLIAEGGKESKCGWLKDQYGVSWQIIPKKLLELKDQENQEKAQKVVQAMLKMEKIDISKLEKANQS